jgi:tetratricopeptide (TPR) repeat protein
MTRGRYLLVLATVLLPAASARAAGIEAKERLARTACLAGDYAKGVALLSELFVSTLNPTYIYNQGRCFEQNRQYEDAISRFQEYLRAGKKLGKEAKAEAQKHIADCREELAQKAPQPAVVAPPPAPPPAPLPPPSLPPAPTPDPATQTVQAGAQPASRPGSGLRTAGIVVTAVGGTALIAGLVLNLKVNSMADDLQKTDGWSDSKESDRKSYATLGWVSYGVGAACVATGAVLYVLGLRSTDGGSGSVALAPAFGSDHAGAVLKGAF